MPGSKMQKIRGWTPRAENHRFWLFFNKENNKEMPSSKIQKIRGWRPRAENHRFWYVCNQENNKETISYDSHTGFIKNLMQNRPCELRSNFLWFPIRIHRESFTKLARWAPEQLSIISTRIYSDFNTKSAMCAPDQFSMISNKNLLRIQYTIGHVSSRTIFNDFGYGFIENSIQNWPGELWSNFQWFLIRIYWEFKTELARWAQ